MDGDFLSLYKSWLVLSWHLVLFLFQKPQGKFFSIPTVLYANCKARFLLKKHKDAKALKVLMKIYKIESRAQEELGSIKDSLKHSTSFSKKNCSQSLNYFCNFSIIQQ